MLGWEFFFYEGLFLLALFVCRRLYLDFVRIKYPPSYRDAASKELHMETRPSNDVLSHMALYYLGRLVGYDSILYVKLLKKLNAPFDSWDVPFADQGKSAEEEIAKYCKNFNMRTYSAAAAASDGSSSGSPRGRWEWDKKPAEYRTMNDWFMRGFAKDLSVDTVVARAHVEDKAPLQRGRTVEILDGERFQRSHRTGAAGDLIVSPAASVVSFFKSWTAMPRKFKNAQWEKVADIGIEEKFLGPFFSEKNETKSAMLLYLSPADYHCFHSPVAGRIVSIYPACEGEGGTGTRGGPMSSKALEAKLANSVSVKEYIFESVNILTRNRRMVIVFELESGGGPSSEGVAAAAGVSDRGRHFVAMVIVGGVTVDSIRMDEEVVQLGNRVHCGQRLGGFARGGSLIGLFFSSEFVLTERNQEAGRLSAADDESDHPDESATTTGLFKVKCGDGLGHLVSP